MAESSSSMALRKMSPTDWDGYKDLIRRWYISDRKTAGGIIEELRKPEHGFEIAWVVSGFLIDSTDSLSRLHELKHRLGIWGLRKNIAPAERDFVVSLRQRMAANHGSLQYSFAGQDLPERRIKRLYSRHRYPITLMTKPTNREH